MTMSVAKTIEITAGSKKSFDDALRTGLKTAGIAKAPPDAETVLVADLDLGEIERQRQGWPFLRDRRIDAYGDMTKRFIDE
jgi:N-carbamoylputrescine amidase